MTDDFDIVPALLSAADSTDSPADANLLQSAAASITLLRQQSQVSLTWSQLGGGRRLGEEQLELGTGIPVGWVQFIAPTIIGGPAKWRPNLSLPGIVLRHPGLDKTSRDEAKSVLQDLVLAWMGRASGPPPSGAVLQAAGSPLATLPGAKE